MTCPYPVRGFEEVNRQGNKLTGADTADCVKNEYWMANLDTLGTVDAMDNSTKCVTRVQPRMLADGTHDGESGSGTEGRWRNISTSQLAFNGDYVNIESE